MSLQLLKGPGFPVSNGLALLSHAPGALPYGSLEEVFQLSDIGVHVSGRHQGVAKAHDPRAPVEGDRRDGYRARIARFFRF